MSFQPVLISSFNSGLTKDKKPYLLIDDAFQQIQNAYTWRETVKKREGIKLIGRLRRCFTSAVTLDNQANGASCSVADILADASFLLRTTEPDAQIEPGGVTIVVGLLSFTDDSSDGVLVEAGAAGTGTINYATGELNLAFSPALGVATNVDVTFCYYPALPAMGIDKRELAAVNDEQQVLFDTKYVYTYDNNNFSTPTSSGTITGITKANPAVVTDIAHGLTGGQVFITGVAGMTEINDILYTITVIDADTFSLNGINSGAFGVYAGGGTWIGWANWAGSDSDFFWMANYRGSTSDSRVFFVTNNAAPASDANNRIRRTSDLSTWTDFEPAVGGKQITNEGFGTNVVTPWATYNNTLANPNIIPGTVVFTVENIVSPNVDPIVGFRDRVDPSLGYPNGILDGSPSTNAGTINYTTGAFTLNFTPNGTSDSTVLVKYQYETSFMFQTKLMVPYYGRMLALNVYEGETAGGSTNFFNRCRFSQVGNPVQQDAWISTTPGKGGFIDAPTNESIVSAQFYKNTLIVFFERSTWELRYVGNVGLPFLWERISSDYGSESTFSTVLFDKGVLAVGDKAVVSTSGNDVERIDTPIPDQVLGFNNEQNGKERVHGTRDFAKELVYWTYSDGGLQNKFPNRTLVFNYQNGTYAIFRDNVTVFGELTTPSGILWDLPISWDSETSWDTTFPAEFPATICGNQQGWIHWYQYPDAETTADALTNMNEHESLAIKDITLSASADISLEIINHNLEQNEIIYVTGLLFVDEATDTAVTTDLNDKFYQVTITDDDNVTLKSWNFTTQQYQTTSHNNLAYTPDPADSDTYIGGGQIALIQNINIITKDFNPFVAQGSHIKMAYTDFMTDATPNSAVSIDLFINSSFSVKGNILTGNKEIETAITQFGDVTGITQANPAVLTAVDHGLQSNQVVTMRDVGGMTEVNGGLFTITFVDDDHFSLGVDSSGFTAYTSGGQWFTQGYRFYLPGSNYAWHRFYATCFGQYISYRIFYDDDLMNTIDTHQSGYELNAMMLWLRQGGRHVL